MTHPNKKYRHIPPYDAKYRFEVKEEQVSKTIEDFFTERFAFKDREYWRELIKIGDAEARSD